ncbi:MAG TPA: CBS domain-containing protein, partial [Polyangiaceae bacterium]
MASALGKMATVGGGARSHRAEGAQKWTRDAFRLARHMHRVEPEVIVLTTEHVSRNRSQGGSMDSLWRYRRPRLVIQSPGTSVYTAARAMAANRVGLLIVQELGKVTGVLSDRDI